MIARSVLVVALFALCASTAAAVQCGSSIWTDLNYTANSFSCSLYNAGVSNKINITVPSPSYATISTRMCSSYDVVTLSPNGSVPDGESPIYYKSRSSSAIVTSKVLIPAGSSVVQFSSRYYCTSGSLSIKVEPTEFEYTNLVPGQKTTVTKAQSGGYLYFKMENRYFGGAVGFKVNVKAFQGIQPPGVFVDHNKLPTLEDFSWSNQTKSVGNGDYEAEVSFFEPANGNYYVAVFLYGSFSEVSVEPTWVYSTPVKILPADTVESGAASISKRAYYQVRVPPGADTMNVQFSRQVPGGFPVLYINPGDLPTTNWNGADGVYQKRLETTVKNSYFSIDIDNPNPSRNNRYANPGYYMFLIEDTDNVASGYLLKVSFS